MLENLRVRTDGDRNRVHSIKKRLKSLKTELSKMERNLNEAVEERDILLEGVVIETSSVAGGDVQGTPGPFSHTTDQDVEDAGGPYNVDLGDSSEVVGTQAGGLPRPGAKKAVVKATTGNVALELDKGKESQFGN